MQFKYDKVESFVQINSIQQVYASIQISVQLHST